MPAEWEPHEAIWLAWPHDPTTFPNRVNKAEDTYIQIIKHIHEGERVNLFVRNERMQQKVTRMLKTQGVDTSKISFFQYRYADVWFRDYGPTFVVNNQNELAMVRWIFNSWGEKYDELLKDRIIPQVINRKMQLRCFEPGIVLEGGSIDVNGNGTLLTTEQCLLNKNRNPSLGKTEIEAKLRDFLNVTQIVWLKEGISGDDTDGHIDDIARFVNPTTVVCAYEKDKNDDNYEVLRINYEILLQSEDQDGKKLKVVKLPIPHMVSDEGWRLPASYANFYIGNKKVLVPIFRCKEDQTALAILRKLFPNREVVGIDCTDLVYGLGTLHCISQQQPSSTST